jgi:hypothetical protein
MRDGPVIILDTSVINRLAVDRKVGDPLMAVLNSGYAVRLTGTNVEEIIAARNGDERDRLLDVCKELLKGKNAEIIRPFHELIEILISEFERIRSFDWRRVSLGLPEYEREVALRELIDDDLSEKQRKYAAGMAAEFEKVFRDDRHHFEELFQAGVRVATILRCRSGFETTSRRWCLLGFRQSAVQASLRGSAGRGNGSASRRFVPALSRAPAGPLCCPI